ncbi:MAG: hypothetical protein ACYC1Q_11300 [Bacteroidia bacterium]
MKGLLLCFLLSLSSLLSADSLDLVFRYYAEDGRLVSAPLSMSIFDGQTTQLRKTDAGGWQHWRMVYKEGTAGITIKTQGHEQTLAIQVHPDWKTTLKTLVINRLQVSREAQVLKVNHLTCRWTAGIAYPIEYRFNNPIDGQELKLQSWSCASLRDSISISLHVLSDSVMLFRCGKNDAILIKYYLASDGKFYRSLAPLDCSVFNTTLEQRFYALLKDSTIELRYDLEGTYFSLTEPTNCSWLFGF